MPAKTLLSIVLCLLLINVNTSAQTVKDSPVVVKTYTVTVTADMLSAVTEINIELYNPNNKVLDGEYNFSLQQNQYVTGFYLDINGHLREGVIVEKQQARVAYENIIRRRVDPGLLEMTAGNNYRIRVYPMPANGSRKIKILISELLTAKENTLQYYLPVTVNNTVQNFTASLIVKETANTPFVADGLLKGKQFTSSSTNHTLYVQEKNAAINKPLIFEIPFENKQQLFVSKTDCSNLFALRIKPQINNNTVSQLKAITLFWDISSSSAKRDVQKELQFLEQFAKQRGVKKITVVNFNTTVSTGKDFYVHNNFNEVKRYLAQQQFDGGTLLGSINCNNYKSDAFILCSDGLNSFGNTPALQSGKPVFCINSSATANHTVLKAIADASVGAYADLSRNSVNEAVAETGIPKITLLAVRQGDKKINSGSPVFSSAGWLTISGALYDTAQDIVVEFAAWGVKTAEQHIPVAGVATISDTPVYFIQMLQRQDDKEGQLQVAQQYKVVTAAASFIVLDNLSDYIDYGIEPPAELQPEYKKNAELVKRKEAEKEYQKIHEELSSIKTAVSLYNERIAWWGKPQSQISISNVEMQAALYTAAQPTNRAAANNATAQLNNGNFKGAALNEVVVVGYGTQRRMNLTGSVSTIQSSQLISNSLTVGQALQGRVAGIQVTSSSGMPGMVENIRIRGSASLGTTAPLYIVNDMPVAEEYVSTISTAEIATITVYKDAQATALYGSRATGGAIVITLRTARNNIANNGIAKYKTMDDVDYVTEMKEAAPNGLYAKYIELKAVHGNDASFFADAAQLLYENGQKEKAVTVLTNMAELNAENHQLLRAMGYVFEEWGMYAYAVDVYKKVLAIKEEEPQSYRDLALAYERNGQHQQAVDLLYKVLTKNFNQYEDRYRGLKALLLNELNAIIAQHKNALNLSKINKAIIEPLPVDIRIVIDWNKDETDIDLHIIEPGGEECFYGHKQSVAGGRLSEDFTQGYGPEEYQIKNAQKGRYSIRVKYYGDRYQKQQVPSFIKLTVYKNFGKPNQSVSTENFIMDHQQGIIEIADLKY